MDEQLEAGFNQIHPACARRFSASKVTAMGCINYGVACLERILSDKLYGIFCTPWRNAKSE